MKRLQNFINGEYIEPMAGSYLPSYNPATGEVYCELPDSDEMDMARAVIAAKKAFPKWAKLEDEARADYLYKIADGIEKRSEEFSLAESMDQGKTLKQAREREIPRAVANFRYFAGLILHQNEKSTTGKGGTLNYSLRQPLGVAGLISPWNLPLYLLTWKIAPAIAVGNTCVAKPSEVTPMTAYLLAEVLQEAKLPKGVVNIVFGLGSKAGQTLVEHPAVPLVSFTGGSATGRIIQETAAPHFKKLSLELGGKNSNIIFDDADLKKALPMTLQSSFLNQGEICLCGSRIFVQEKIYDQFLEEFVAATKELVVGDPGEDKTFMGPLVSKEHFDKVQSCLVQAKKDGGKILTGEEPLELPKKFTGGYFMRPVVIADLDRCSVINQEEIFGPVVSVLPFKYAHEVVEWSNGTSYGLSASIWTQNLSKAHKVAGKLEAGTVWVNTWLNRDLRMPFGGWKASGIGREGGDHSLDFYCEQKTVCLQL